MGETNLKETILEGYIYTSFGWYQPTKADFLPIAEQEEAIRYKSYRIKILGNIRNIDSGAFEVCGTQCRIRLMQFKEPDEHLELVIDAKTHHSDRENWWYYKTKPLTVANQIFIWDFCQEKWIDATTTTGHIAKVHTKHELEKRKKWNGYYYQLCQLGFSKKEVKTIMGQLKWNELKIFIECIQLLRDKSFLTAYILKMITK